MKQLDEYPEDVRVKVCAAREKRRVQEIIKRLESDAHVVCGLTQNTEACPDFIAAWRKISDARRTYEKMAEETERTAIAAVNTHDAKLVIYPRPEAPGKVA